MTAFTPWNDQKLIDTLKNGGVAVMPTDTIYGVVGRAENEDTVNRIYAIKKRQPEKPCIILISNITELANFSAEITLAQKEKLEIYWSFDSAQDFRPVSVILDCTYDRFSYLHRGTQTLAFRMPAQKELQNLLKETGPLIAPSANPEGLPPAKNTEEAKKYFGESMDIYADGGEIAGSPSKVIKLHKDGTESILRA
jgi:L-threonylcarbamoyladenylate synthase